MMRARLARVMLIPWAGLFLFVSHWFFSAPMIYRFGARVAAVVCFLAITIWSSVFYLLLGEEGSLDRLQARLAPRLAQLTVRQDRGLLGKSREWLYGCFPDRPLLLATAVSIFTFATSGAFFGVLTLRLARPHEGRRDLPLVWLGCIANVLIWNVLVYGTAIEFIRPVIDLILSFVASEIAGPTVELLVRLVGGG